MSYGKTDATGTRPEEDARGEGSAGTSSPWPELDYERVYPVRGKVICEDCGGANFTLLIHECGGITPACEQCGHVYDGGWLLPCVRGTEEKGRGTEAAQVPCEWCDTRRLRNRERMRKKRSGG